MLSWPLISSEILGKLFNLSSLLFSNMCHGDKSNDFTGWLQGSNARIHLSKQISAWHTMVATITIIT